MALNRCAVSSRDLFAFILSVGLLSLLLNYHISYYGNNMVNHIPADSDGTASAFLVEGTLRFKGTDEVDSKVFGRSLSEHPADNALSQSPKRAHTDLLQKITEIEARLSTGKQHIVAIMDPAPEDSTPLVHRLDDIDVEIVWSKDVLTWVHVDTIVQGNWSVLFCHGESRCPVQNVKISQKVDRIPNLQPFVNNPEVTCKIAKLSEMESGLKTAPCEPLNCKSPPEGAHVMAFETRTFFNTSVSDICEGNNVSQEKSFVWYLPDKPVMFPAGPILRLQCLVTSLSPLRFYVHQEMLTGSYASLQSSTLFQKITIEDVLQSIAETYGLGTSSRWWREVRRTLMLYLTYVETETMKTSTTNTDGQSCSRCFHCIQVDIICTSVQRCRIIQVNSSPEWQKRYLSKTVPMVASKQQVSGDVVQAIENSMQNIQICDVDDNAHGNCLSKRDIIYLIDWRREMQRKQSWIQIYPSKYGCHQMEQLQTQFTSYSSPTMKVNKMLMSLGDFFQRTVPSATEYLNDENEADYIDTRVTESHRTSAGEASVCSNDPKDIGKLEAIYTIPRIDLEELSPRSYNGTVGYHTILVRVWAYSKCCKCQVKLENKYNEPGARNITLGLGENKIMIYIVDSTSQDLEILSTISVSLYRTNRGLVSSTGNRGHLKTCTLKQECSLKFDQAAGCGLMDLNQQLFPSSNLNKKCSSGDHEGQWVVPCHNCADENSCFWSQAHWLPYECHYETFSPFLLRKCLIGKKLLFIGDSTNRGVTNYIIQQINGSLYDWDKTHSTRSYFNVNQGNTQFAFAYYPHFWLPADHRPKFSKVIYQLIKSSLPLQNNSNTILVVGGVHWLSQQHIDLLVEALRSKGLSGITKVVKGLGAGFHQPVENVRFVPDSQQSSLQQRESDILRYAKTKDFNVVATFNMTISRYKDFMEGKCACHFHKVSRHGSNSDGYRYTVEGDTNAAYSQILLNQICPNLSA